MGLHPIIVFLSVFSGLVLANSVLHHSKRSDNVKRNGNVFIVGGNEVTPYSLPFMVQLSRRGNAEIQDVWCGGAAIDEYYILTAAHCVSTNRKFRKRLRVTAAEHDITETEGFEQRYQVAKVIRHPQYSWYTLENDVALLKLKTPLDLSSPRVAVIGLNTDDDCPVDDQVCQVAGWGALRQQGGFPDKLQEVSVSVVGNDACNARSVYNGEVFDSMLCAGEEQGGKDSCQGDSGGPFVCTCNGTLAHVGIVSWGEGCARAGKPGVYTRTSSFVPWIENCIANDGNNCGVV